MSLISGEGRMCGAFGEERMRSGDTLLLPGALDGMEFVPDKPTRLFVSIPK